MSNGKQTSILPTWLLSKQRSKEIWTDRPLSLEIRLSGTVTEMGNFMLKEVTSKPYTLFCCDIFLLGIVEPNVMHTWSLI